MERKAVADSVIRIPCQSLQGFFESWFNMLKPIHGLSNTEIKLISTILRFRYEFSLKITDKDLLDEYLMSTETKQKIREDCNMSPSSFQVSMFKLKKHKVIIDNRVNPKLIPSFSGDNYRLLLYFDVKDDGCKKA